MSTEREMIGKLEAATSMLRDVISYLDKSVQPQPEPRPLDSWRQLIKEIAESPQIPNNIKPAVLAQSIVETGRGASELFRLHLNAHGMKWRDEMVGIATSVLIKVPSESEPVVFCKFTSIKKAVEGYYRFLQRNPYKGWDSYKHDAKAFLLHICKVWAADPQYYTKCVNVLNEAKELLAIYGWKEEAIPTPPVNQMPKVDVQRNSPNQSDRNAIITHIILHNTAGEYNGAVSWLSNAASKVSAHIVISRTGHVTQLVPFARRAWHAGNSRINACSLGIELEATNSNKGITAAQEAVLIQWCKYLMHTYGISADNIVGHRIVSDRPTSCPNLIWPIEQDLRTWVNKNLR